MTNDLRLAGKVLNAYVDEQGHFVCTVAVVHDHYVDGFNNTTESIFRAFLMDRAKSAHVDVQPGDRVLISGYLRQDRRLTNTGNERKHNTVYIRGIEVTTPAQKFGRGIPTGSRY